MRFIFYIFIFGTFILRSQESIGVFNNQPVDPCGGVLMLNKRPVPQAYNREADMAWEKRIWRELDLRDKLNQPLYFPIDNQPCRISLFQLVTKHILTGEIVAFGDEEFYRPLSLSEARNKLVQQKDVAEVFYDSLGNEYSTINKHFDSTSIFTSVIKVRMKEDWYLNSGRSDVEVRIVALAFYEYVEEKEAYKELFWVFFPAIKPILAKYRVFNPRNTNDNSSFDDLFTRREFSSLIIKETNVYDRYVADYCKGIDALLESDRIKNDLFRFEHDLWDY
ncbi:MAG TPA: gliding motility protein GldN [Bacteroidia bacterium]|jgi:gliding motility associated protien GldN|nr:gliding motility protein GldN [Bacteroidia bacterium]